jgi:hypothetical protein
MFTTQTFQELGCPLWALQGMYADQEDPHSHPGYGLGQDVAVATMLKRLQEKHGPNAVVVNVEITSTRPPFVNDCYGRYIWHLTGDLYLREEEKKDECPECAELAEIAARKSAAAEADAAYDARFDGV